MGLVTTLPAVLVIFLLMGGGCGRFEHGIYFSVIACSAGPAIAAKEPDDSPWPGSGASAPTKDHAAQHWPRGWFWRWIRKSVLMALTSMGGANLAGGE
jgi:hypothetical protein